MQPPCTEASVDASIMRGPLPSGSILEVIPYAFAVHPLKLIPAMFLVGQMAADCVLPPPNASQVVTLMAKLMFPLF